MGLENTVELLCPIWKLASITVHEPFEYFERDLSPITLVSDGPQYTAVTDGYLEADNEAYDEMVHIWKSVDHSCFVSIKSMDGWWTALDFSRRSRNEARPDPPEMYLPESATLHRFVSQCPNDIGTELWENWDQVVNMFHESMPKAAQRKAAVLRCAARLLKAPYSDIGMC